MCEGVVAPSAFPKLLSFQSEAINLGIVIRDVDPAIGQRQSTEVRPGVQGSTTLVKHLACLSVESTENSSVGVVFPLLNRQQRQILIADDPTFLGLPNVFPIGKCPYDTIGNNHWFGDVEFCRNPGWFQNGFLGSAVQSDFKRHETSVRIRPVGFRKLWSVLGNRAQYRN